MSEEIISEVQTETPEPAEQISTEPTATDQTPDQPQEEQEADAKPERKFTQDELDKIVQKRLAKERKHVERAAAAEREAQMLREQMRSLTQPESKSVQSGMPQPAQFQDYESYISALTDWKVEQRIGELQQRREAEEQARQRQTQIQTVQQKLATASEKYDDFEDVALNPDVPITQAMAQAIAESDMAGDLAYYLGANLKEALRISSLSPIAQIREIAKLETTLGNSTPAVTKAPPPIKPVGQKATVTKDPSQMTDREFAEWRKKQIASRR